MNVKGSFNLNNYSTLTLDLKATLCFMVDGGLSLGGAAQLDSVVGESLWIQW